MEKVKNIITQIENTKNVKILYACETGSRAWGFPSPDSDYDVRFIYMHEKDWYLHLQTKKDTIEFMDGDWDVTGWDLRKSLLLLKKSNAPLIERFNSPIEYFSVPNFKLEFNELIKAYYSPIAVFFHHYSLAIKFWDGITNKDEYRLKTFFYLVRSLLSCNWILKDSNVVPMEINKLMKYSDDTVNKRLNDLIALKSTVNEKYLHAKDLYLAEWIANVFDELEKSKNNLAVCKADMKLLNDYFLQKMK
jgi:uncharacterized protein